MMFMTIDTVSCVALLFWVSLWLVATSCIISVDLFHFIVLALDLVLGFMMWHIDIFDSGDEDSRPLAIFFFRCSLMLVSVLSLSSPLFMCIYVFIRCSDTHDMCIAPLPLSHHPSVLSPSLRLSLFPLPILLVTSCASIFYGLVLYTSTILTHSIPYISASILPGPSDLGFDYS